jgi:hypothetical protein
VTLLMHEVVAITAAVDQGRRAHWGRTAMRANLSLMMSAEWRMSLP